MSEGNSVRLALIGLGKFSGTIASTVQRSQRAKLVTCFDIVPANSKAASEKYGIMQKIRYLDKLIDELAKGKAMEKILRT